MLPAIAMHLLLKSVFAFEIYISLMDLRTNSVFSSDFFVYRMGVRWLYGFAPEQIWLTQYGGQGRTVNKKKRNNIMISNH